MRTAAGKSGAGIALAALAVLTGCSAAQHSVAGSGRPGPTSAPVSQPATAPSVRPAASRSAASAVHRVPSTAPRSRPAPAPAPSSGQPPVAPSTPPAAPSSAPAAKSSSVVPIAAGAPDCQLSALRVMALRGGASMGQEYALLTFTNDGSTPCQLSGYPTVTLEHQGSPLGASRAAQTAGSGSVTLRSGATAQVRVHVGTSCAAPQSDHVEVSVPQSDGSVAVPLTLRGCTLHVEAFQPGG